MSKNHRRLRLWGFLVAVLLVFAAGIGWHQARLRTWRLELTRAREAMNAGRYGLAREILSRLTERWTVHGEDLLLLGECELLRGRREEALAIWARVPLSSPSLARAARYRASNLIHLGRYSPAEATLLQALANPGQSGASDLERELNQLYRYEGRFDDMRRVLRGSWWRSADPAGVLKELWMLDHSPIPIEAWQLAHRQGRPRRRSRLAGSSSTRHPRWPISRRGRPTQALPEASPGRSGDLACPTRSGPGNR